MDSSNITDNQTAKSPNASQKITVTDIDRPRDDESDNQAKNKQDQVQVQEQ